MMLLFLPFLLVNVASVAQLVEHFECGSDSFPYSREAASLALGWCNTAVRDGANLCCKLHDSCYDEHRVRGYTREHCDERFCYCLQDVNDKAKTDSCAWGLNAFCSVVKHHAKAAFETAAPPTDLELKYVGFVDQQPLNADMASLVEACHGSQAIAVHCHNTVVRCLEGPHERIRRSSVEHSYEDCRSTMHDCLQNIIDNNASETCTAIAHRIAKQVNIYIELEESKYGQTIIDTYPIIAARLLKQCPESTYALEYCFSTFHACGITNRKERPELLNAVRQIGIECHRDLSLCISEAIRDEQELNEDCYEARALATSRIRDKELVHVEPKSWTTVLYESWGRRKRMAARRG